MPKELLIVTFLPFVSLKISYVELLVLKVQRASSRVTWLVIFS